VCFIEYNEEEIEFFYKRISTNVKKIRESKNISQLDMALTIGHKAASFYGKAELCREGKHFNIEHLYKLAKALDVDIKEFFE